jgi:hypothetical protein
MGVDEMGQNVRTFGRRMALETLTDEEIAKVSGGWPCTTQPETYCPPDWNADDCGCDS